MQQGNCGCSSPNSTCSKVETLACFGHTEMKTLVVPLPTQLGEEAVLIRFLWRQSHNGFQNVCLAFVVSVCFPSCKFPLPSFCCSSRSIRSENLRIEPQWGGAAVSGPPLRRHQLCDQSCYSFQYITPPVRRYSNIYVSFVEIQQYIYISPLRRSNNIYIYIRLL